MLLQVQRSTCAMRVAFVPLEANTTHWAAKLPLPANVPFEVIHKATGTVVHTGDGGPTNRMYLPSDLLFTGERYVPQSKTSPHLLAARTDFVVAPPPTPLQRRGGGGRRRRKRRHGRCAGGHAANRACRGRRAHGASCGGRSEGAPLPVKVPYIVRHKDTETVVIEGYTSIGGVEVECEPWFVNNGALLVGEAYVLTVPKGQRLRRDVAAVLPWASAPPTPPWASLAARGAGERSEVRRRRGTPGRDRGGARARARVCDRERAPDLEQGGHRALVGAAAAAALAALFVRNASDFTVVGQRVIEIDGKAQEHVRVDDAKVPMVAHQRYTIELQPSSANLRSTCDLRPRPGTAMANALTVYRASRPAIVVVLRASDEDARTGVALPVGMRVLVRHAELKCKVAEYVTTQAESDTEVRVVLQCADAFYVGEQYTCEVEGEAVGSAVATFVVEEVMEDVVLDSRARAPRCRRASSRCSRRAITGRRRSRSRPRRSRSDTRRAAACAICRLPGRTAPPTCTWSSPRCAPSSSATATSARARVGLRAARLAATRRDATRMRAAPSWSTCPCAAAPFRRRHAALAPGAAAAAVGQGAGAPQGDRGDRVRGQGGRS